MKKFRIKSTATPHGLWWYLQAPNGNDIWAFHSPGDAMNYFCQCIAK